MRIDEAVHSIEWDHLPSSVQNQARRCLLDTLGTAIAGRRTAVSPIAYEFAATVYPGRGTPLWLDGREVSPPGAALAHGMTIDSFDIHDGYKLGKGHAGVAIVPSSLATLSLGQGQLVSGKELLATLVMGYEVALRAAIALHTTSCDFHSSGAWNVLGCAAVTARRLHLGTEQTRHALGIAEYHGPRSQLMRCVDHPAMIKDGSGWGAMAGVSAALLAQHGFTGAPALTVEAPDVAAIWSDLGTIWLINDQYFKPYAVCRWAQPAIFGALALQRTHDVSLDDIRHIRVFTFHEATRLTCRHPHASDEAQYSLPFPVASALVHGKLDLAELTGDALTDPVVLRLADCIELVEAAELDARFPAERLARVEIETMSGMLLDSGVVTAAWDDTSPPTDAELHDKFRRIAGTVLPGDRTRALEELIWNCAEVPNATALLELLAPPA